MRTNKDVEELQAFLKEKQKEVDAKKAACDVFLEEMGKQRSEAEAQQANADKEKRRQTLLRQRRRSWRSRPRGTSVAKPALEAANDAELPGQSLDDELKGFTNPWSGW